MALNVPKFDNPLHKRILLAILLVVAVFVAYWPCLQGEFICDDNDDVVNNLALRTWDGLVSLWTTPGVTAQYYPLTFTSFWLNYQWGGLDPLGYHLVNVLFHALNALLLWAVLRRLQIPGAWLGAALWALHPVNVESVAYIDERKNVLSGFFFLLSLWFAIRFWLGQGTRLEAGLAGQSQGVAASSGFARLVDPLVIVRSTCPSDLVKLFERFYFSQGLARIMAQWGGFWSRVSAMRAYILSIICFSLALLAKTAVLPLPAVILLLVWWRRKPTLRDALFLLPMVVMGVGLSLVTLHLEHHLVAAADLWHLSWPQRFILAGRAIWFYLGKLIWPHPLIFCYPRWTLNPSDVTQYLPLAAAIIVAGFLIWKRKGWARPLAVALAFFVLMLFLMLGFFNLYMFRFTFVSDHFQYLASMGPLAMASGFLAKWAQGCKPVMKSLKIFNVVCTGFSLIFALVSFKDSSYFQSPGLVWKKTLAFNPDSSMAGVNLGNWYYKETHEVKKAVGMFKMVIRKDPSNFEAIADYGVALVDSGFYEEGLNQYEKAYSINSSFPSLLNDFAWIYSTCPDPQFRDGKRALGFSKKACSLTGYGNPQFIGTLAAAYAENGDFDKAVLYARMAEQASAAVGNAEIVEKNRKLLNYYENRKPFREVFPQDRNGLSP